MMFANAEAYAEKLIGEAPFHSTIHRLTGTQTDTHNIVV